MGRALKGTISGAGFGLLARPLLHVVAFEGAWLALELWAGLAGTSAIGPAAEERLRQLGYVE